MKLPEDQAAYGCGLLFLVSVLAGAFISEKMYGPKYVTRTRLKEKDVAGFVDGGGKFTRKNIRCVINNYKEKPLPSYN